MTQPASELLELGVVKAALRRRTQTPLGVEQADGLALFESVEAVRDRVEAIDQARALLDLAEPPPVWGAEDVRAPLELGEKGIVMEAVALRGVANTMTTGSVLKKHLAQHAEVAPLLYGHVAPLSDLSRLASDVARCFDPDGQLADNASRELGPLRQRVRSIKDTIHTKLDDLLRASNIEPYLQESYFTIRADRHVLPIKASFKNEVKGIVHDASGSGQTVFIEPQVLVDLGNRLKIAQSEQAEEEQRILSRLTRMVVSEAPAIREMMDVIGLVDLIAAGARLAVDLRAIPVVPDSAPGFSLKDARHPLLLLQEIEPTEDETPPDRQKTVIGNDLGLEPQQNVLVLTGPNTGGKTVALKTVGLFALMVRLGLHLPCAEGSKLGWYQRIEATIGDQQSIASNLSTFAAHMKSLVDILGRAGSRSLVLIDEIAADTDPTQGQALAQAVLEELASRGAHVVVTTHFERLKAVPIVDTRFRNAGVGFDPKRLRPTYRITLDVPQGSSGFDIAASLGLPKSIVERGRDLIGEGSNELQRLMTELESRSKALASARADADAAREAAETAREEAETRAAELAGEIERVRKQARDELLVEIEASRDEVREIVKKLQAASDGASARDAMRAANQAADQLGKLEKAEREKVAEPEVPAQKRLETVEVGAWVHVATLARDGEVVQVDGREATVQVGSIRARAPLSSLLTPQSSRPAKEKAKAKAKAAKSYTVTRPEEPAESRPPARVVEQIDLRGHTVDASIDRLEAFLDYHYGTPTTHVCVIHGHGTGALREALREHLQRSGYVKSLRPGEHSEGGDGVTVVALA